MVDKFVSWKFSVFRIEMHEGRLLVWNRPSCAGDTLAMGVV